MREKDAFLEGAGDLMHAAEDGDPNLSVRLRAAMSQLATWDLPIGVKKTHWNEGGPDAVAWLGVLPRRLDGVNRWMSDWTRRKQARAAWGRLLRQSVCQAEGIASIVGLDDLGRAPDCKIRMGVQIVRFVPHVRNFLKDDDSLAGAPKQLYDAMKDVGLIREDRREWLTMRPAVQDVTPIAGVPCTVFVLWPETTQGGTRVYRSIRPAAHQNRESENRGTQTRRTIPGL